MRPCPGISITLLTSAALFLSAASVQAQLGSPISAPAALNTNAVGDTGDDGFPQFATDGAGNWVAVWQSTEALVGLGSDNDILVSTSSDNGANWSAPAALNTNANSDAGEDTQPQIAHDGAGNWVAVWESTEDLDLGAGRGVFPSAGTDPDILVSTSDDNGATWSAPAALNNNAGTDTGDDRYPQVATDAAGNWVAVWDSNEDLVIGEDFDGRQIGIGADRDIFFAVSTNNGGSWTDPLNLNTNAESDAGDDQFAQVNTDAVGNWVSVWDSTENLGGIGVDNDVLFSRSVNVGGTWSGPAALNLTAGVDTARDQFPQVTPDGLGNWMAVWESEHNLTGIGNDADILFATSTDNGATWSTAGVLNNTAGTDDGNADLVPQVCTDQAGTWLAVWESDHDIGGSGPDRDVMIARSTDLGQTWTNPQPLNTNATADSEPDFVPQIATDWAGNWWGLWASDEGIGGSGGDRDIFIARFGLPDCNGNFIADAEDLAQGSSQDCDGNSVPDECDPDSDGDNAIDACEQCPNDPNKVVPGQCNCGSPDTDSDGDNTADCNDGCPTDGNKLEGGVCGCGAVEDLSDVDADGVADCVDNCPLANPDQADGDGDGLGDVCEEAAGQDIDPNACGTGACGAGVATASLMGLLSLCGAKFRRRRIFPKA